MSERNTTPWIRELDTWHKRCTNQPGHHLYRPKPPYPMVRPMSNSELLNAVDENDTNPKAITS